MTWPDELHAMLIESKGDLGMFVALAALRRTENGRPGREFGVLSYPAPTYAQQLRGAYRGLHTLDADLKGMKRSTRTPEGFFTREFLTKFSSKWAPLGASNDPTNMNAQHTTNLLTIHASLVARCSSGLMALPGGALAHAT